jgi:hypothetical protein
LTRCVESAKGIRLVCGRGGFAEPIMANGVVQMLFVKTIPRTLKFLSALVIKAPESESLVTCKAKSNPAFFRRYMQLSEDASSDKVEAMKLVVI